MTPELNLTRNISLECVRPSDADGEVIKMWLHGRSKHTQQAYYSDVRRFLDFVDDKPLHQITLADVQAFDNALLHLSQASRARKLSAVKSLLSFGQRIGYLAVNVGAPVRLPPQKNTLAERILSESDVHRMITLEQNKRNRVLLTLLYSAGVRVSELCNLTWRDLQERGDTGQITVFGKGGKTRAILLPSTVWAELISLNKDGNPDDPVFRSRKGGKKLDRSQVFRIVRAVAKAANIPKDVSCHWFRHAHASHALDRGASIHLVQETLGHSSVATTGRYLHARPSDSSSRYLSI